MASARTLSTTEEYKELVDRYDTWLFECATSSSTFRPYSLTSPHRFRRLSSLPPCSCDGVIWEGDHVIGKAGDTLRYLRQQGKRIFFVTNNATKSRAANKGKFDKMGIDCSVVRLPPLL